MASSVKLSKVPDSSPGPKIWSAARRELSGVGRAQLLGQALHVGPVELAHGLGAGQGVDRRQVEAVGEGDGPDVTLATGRQGRGHEQAHRQRPEEDRGASHGTSATLRIRRDMTGAVS